MKCDECNKEIGKGDTVHQHLLEDERGYAATGINLCDDCDGKHTYRYVTGELKSV